MLPDLHHFLDSLGQSPETRKAHSQRLMGSGTIRVTSVLTLDICGRTDGFEALVYWFVIFPFSLLRYVLILVGHMETSVGKVGI